MKKVNWTTEELENVRTQLTDANIPEDSVTAVINKLGGVTPAKISKGTLKGLKIALTRRGNKLGCSFLLNIQNNSAKISSFTGTDSDLAALKEVATGHGYELN